MFKLILLSFTFLSINTFAERPPVVKTDVTFVNFNKVDDFIFRAGIGFNFEGTNSIKMSTLKKGDLNIKKILFVGPDKFAYAAKEEDEIARKNGFDGILTAEASICLTPGLCSLYPSEKITEVLATMIDEDNQPLLMHCLAGKDRTGLFIALYNVYFRKVTKEEAMTDFKKDQGINKVNPLVGNVDTMIEKYARDEETITTMRNSIYAELAKRKNKPVEDIATFYNVRYGL